VASHEGCRSPSAQGLCRGCSHTRHGCTEVERRAWARRCRWWWGSVQGSHETERQVRWLQRSWKGKESEGRRAKWPATTAKQAFAWGWKRQTGNRPTTSCTWPEQEKEAQAELRSQQQTCAFSFTFSGIFCERRFGVVVCSIMVAAVVTCGIVRGIGHAYLALHAFPALSHLC